MTRRITTLTAASLVAAGALMAGGCQERGVFGQRSYQNSVYGNTATFPRNPVHGTADFRNPVQGTPEFARRDADTARTASVGNDTPSRSEPIREPAPTRAAGDVPLDQSGQAQSTMRTEVRPVEPARTEVTRAEVTRSDTDRPAPAVDRPAPTDNDRPVARPTEPPAQDRPLVRNDARPEIANDPGRRTSVDSPDGRNPEMVARAASARYPDDLKPSDESLASVSINRDNKSVRIANNSSREIQGGSLWVNEMYVHPIPSIPAGGSANVATNQFFNREGHVLPALTESSKLQLQSAGKLYNLRLVQGDGSSDFNK